MTATRRVSSQSKVNNTGDGVLNVSMDNQKMYGEVCYNLSFYKAAKNDAVILRADWKKIKEMFGDDVQMEPNTIVVPDTIPASLLEVEYKPSQWTSIDEAIKQLK